MRPRSPSIFVLAALGLSLVSGQASAFCRTTTSRAPAGYDPAKQGCWTDGVPLAWHTDSVPYGVNKAASKQVGLADATRIAHLAFNAWNGVVCAGGPPSIEAFDNGPLSYVPTPDGGCTDSSSCDPASDDVIVFDDASWPYNDSVNTLALTTVTYGVQDGRIFEAYTEVNSAPPKMLTLQEPPPAGSTAYDLQAILTHEAGHFLGLAHATSTDPVMYAFYSAGRITLTQDDIDGFCTIYPPKGSRGCGCRGVGGDVRGLAAPSLALGAVLAVYVRRRRSRKKSSTASRSSV